MPITTHRNPARNRTTFECNGSLLLNEIVVVIERFFQGDVAPPTKNILWDMRTASVNSLTVDHADQVATLINGYQTEGRGLKVAAVISKDIDFEIAKEFKEKSRDALKIIRVFRHIDEAKEWLRKD